MGIRWSAGIVLAFAPCGCADPEPPKSSSEERTAAKYLTTEELEKSIAAGNENEEKPPPSSPADYTFGIESRDHQLWLHTGTDPQLYTVKAKDGTLLAVAIDDERLELDYPELHALLRDEGSLIDTVDY